MSGRPILDSEQRRRILTELGTSMLVEAGAGSGKTTELVGRLVALIRSGTAEVGEIAAVTFTRKAAAELRERFQTLLEQTIAWGDGGPPIEHDDGDPPSQDELDRLRLALEEIERGFIGTIHAFCARLLRERPIEARLDPAFREIFGPEEDRLRRQAWDRHLERLTTTGNDSLAKLRAVNLEASSLFRAYREVVEQPDVVFPLEVHEAPEVGDLRTELAAIVADAVALLPLREPDPKWGPVQNKIRQLEQIRSTRRWDNDAVFLDALEPIVGHKLKPTYKRWGEHGDAIRPIETRLVRFADPEGPAGEALRRWLAYRYKIVIEFVQEAAKAYAQERRNRGLVTFNDLLMDTARLLRTNTAARRDLGRRYRYLLVDEFQDTDPLQAEIVFLLTATKAEQDNWHLAVPRPGSLFVVGDPKQSIYRFRRADISIYNQVKARLQDCGEVLLLTTNFRSQPPIEEFVNGVFSTFFPQEATEHQAAFAPLNVANDDRENQGVFCYDVPSAKYGADAVAEIDAPLVASWIKTRIDDDKRGPGDFMVLAYRKDWLGAYGTELEKRGIPFQITGSGVDIGEELSELVTVLRALADPHNPVLTAAALVGLFFGIDHEELAAHRLEHPQAEELGRRMFDFTTAAFAEIDDASSRVERALNRLRNWWKLTLRLPADVVVGTIVEELGLFSYLAAGDAGSSNAGALAYVLNAVRRAGVDGDTSVRAALDALDEALRADEVEAPLRPGRDDVVRIMNLHKAKGLEAKVVILAHPAGLPGGGVSSIVRRPEEGEPEGALIIKQSTGQYQSTKVAAPLNWDELVKREEPFETAEDERLLYVAATRAQEELVIAYCGARENKSPWHRFYPFRESLCQSLDAKVVAAPERTPLTLPAATVEAAVDELRADRASRAEPSYQISSVTKLVKHDASIFKVDGGGLGRAWGNAVHEALEAANRDVEGKQLTAVCRAALLDNDLPIDSDGEPSDLQGLVELVGAVQETDTWTRARQADRVLVEAPFAALDAAADGDHIVEGVIDLCFREADGWVIADYKTDVVDAEDNREARRQQYRAQVDRYAAFFEQITGERVKERQLLWVGMGPEVETW